MDAISVVASGLLNSQPPPAIIPLAHAGTLVATDGVNVMSMSNTTTGNLTVGPLSDLSQVDNTYSKPGPLGSSIQTLNYGAGVFMLVDAVGVSYWSDDLGANWTLGTGHDPAFNSVVAGYYSDRLGVFMHNNHQPTYSIDGKVKIDALGQPQVISAAGGFTQLDFKGSTYNYALNSQRFLWYNTGTDFTTGWAQCTRNAARDTYAMATDGNVVANLQAFMGGGLVQINSSTDGVTFGADITTSGFTITNPRHIMYHRGEWVAIDANGSCWTSDDLITWVAQGDTYLTGTSSGVSNTGNHTMDNQNIIRWGSGEGQSRANFAIFFQNQVYQSVNI